jgi:acyl carrier protein
MSDVADPQMMRAALSEVIQETTGIAIAPDVNFFEGGISSADLVRVHRALVARLGRDIPLLALFRYPNVRAFAGHLATAATAGPPPAPGRPVWTAGAGQSRKELRARIREGNR